MDHLDTLAQEMVNISNSVRGEAQIASRPGQMDRLEALAEELASLATRVRKTADLAALNIQEGGSGDG